MTAPAPMRNATKIRAEHLEAVGYFPDPELVTSVNLALQLQMPLLLTGEPGTGKTMFAIALAMAFGHQEPLRCDVRSDSTARDLLYHHDAVARFADAQGNQQERASDARNYIQLQGLGQALAWGENSQPVLLVDEIDKAPRDLPNDLLRELEEGWFRIPEILASDPNSPLQPRMGRVKGAPRPSVLPLVIITSNAERQLPDPFLRRCIFHHIAFPRPERLMQIVLAQAFPESNDRGERAWRAELAGRVVRVFEEIRKRDLHKPPATSELIQWTSALATMYRREVVAESLDEALRQIRAREEIAWRDLPALQCLVKLKEDYESLSAPTWGVPGG